jgi:hypothetical protein
MKQTKTLLANLVDGLLTYVLWYFIKAAMISLGILLLSTGKVFWMALGAVLLIRQAVILLTMPSDLHVKKNKSVTTNESK